MCGNDAKKYVVLWENSAVKKLRISQSFIVVGLSIVI